MKWAALIAVIALAGTAAEASAAPKPGARYDGESGTGQRVFLTVTSDGSRLDAYGFVFHVRCSDGRKRIQGLNEVRERPVLIAADGTFANAVRPWRAAHRGRDGRRIWGIARTRVAGQFDASGDVVTGTLSATFSSRRLRCRSGELPFTAYLDGTPGAPFRDARTATGTYRGRAGSFAVTLEPFVPGRFVDPIEVDWVARCRSGGTLTGATGFRGTDLRGSRFRFVGRHTNRLRGGFRSRQVHRMSGRFFFDGAYRARVVWRMEAAVLRRGRRVDTCRASRTFIATLDESTTPDAGTASR